MVVKQMTTAQMRAKAKREHPEATPEELDAMVEKMRRAEAAEMAAVRELAEADGVWRTVSGRRIFIAKGEDAKTAMERSLVGDKAQSVADHRSAMSYHANMAKRAAQSGDKAAAVAHEKAIGAHADAIDKGDKGSSAKANIESDRAHNPKEYRDETAVAELAHANAVRGIEIFAPGEHNGDKYTEQDIDDMVAAHGELDYRPAIKIGHSKDAPGSPAYGYVTALRKVGGKLIADFESMHDSVVQAIKDKRYGRVSSEIYFNLKRGGKVFRRALKAVALLGAEVPAVANLVPLHKMEFAASGFESVAECEQDLEVRQQAIIDALAERVETLTETLNQQKEQDAMTIKELKEKKAALEAQITELNKLGEKMTAEDRARITALSAEVKTFGEKIDREIETLTAAADKSKGLEAQVAALAAKDRAREVTDRIARCTVVAFRPDLEALYAHAMANPEAKVKHFSATDKDGKRAESEKTLLEVIDGVVAGINAGAKRFFVVDTEQRGGRREEGAGDDAGAELDEKAKTRVRDGKSKDYAEACDAVLAEDAELKTRYHEQQSTARQKN